MHSWIALGKSASHPHLVEFFTFQDENGTGSESAMTAIGALSSFRELGEMSLGPAFTELTISYEFYFLEC
jgi:hypothetical protein